MIFGKRNTDLHRAAGMYRIQRAKELLPHRHHIDEIVKDGTKLFFRFHVIQPLAITFAVRRIDFQRGVDKKDRDMHFLSTTVNFLPGNFT